MPDNYEKAWRKADEDYDRREQQRIAREEEELLTEYTRWLFDRQGVHDGDRRFTSMVPRFLAERARRERA